MVNTLCILLVVDLSGGACIVHPIVKEGGTIQGVIASVKISDDGCGSQQYPLTVQVIIGFWKIYLIYIETR